MENKKKIGLLGCIMTGIGAIIGSGIFGSLSAEINEVGYLVIASFILAALYILARAMPPMYTTTIIPTSGGHFLYATKLMHPYIGLFVIIQSTLMPVLVAAYSLLFSDYFCQLIPSLNGKQKIVAITVLAVYGIIALFGTHVITKFNSFVVILLLVAVGLYILLGLPHIDFNHIAMNQHSFSDVKLSTFVVSISVLANCIGGAVDITQIANDVHNPSSTIPKAVFISTALVSVIYILMALITLGCRGDGSIDTLATVASSFMSPSLVVVFVICGPICGVLTSMVPIMLMIAAQLNAAAESGVFPQAVGKKNRHGVAQYCLMYVVGFAIIAVASGTSFVIMFTVFAAVCDWMQLPSNLIPLMLKKKYPHACNNPGFKINYVMTAILSVIAFVTAIYLSVTTILTLGKGIWTLIILTTIILIVYFVIRIKYLKGKGRDLIKELKQPYQPWEEHEEECRQLDLEHGNN